MANESLPIRVLLSYSHADDRLRRRLNNHMSVLRRMETISSWDDRLIIPGASFEEEIFRQLDSANIILLLISADFLASEFCYTKEMVRAIQRHEAGEARVIPIILRPVDNWQVTPFGRLLALPTDGKPVTSWRNRDEAFVDVAGGIRRAVDELAQNTAAGIRSSQFSPHIFIGTVVVNGLPAPVGTEVRALIGGKEHGSTTVGSDGRYSLQVNQGTDDHIAFRIEMLTACQTARWVQGGADVLDLTADSDYKPRMVLG